jgi:hypothetical protein
MKNLILLLSLCLFSSVSWSGCVQGNCANGQGTLTLPSGEKYVGQFKDGKKNGQGTNTWPYGQKYVGQWKKGKFNGQGTYTWRSGQKYVGQWKDSVRNGQGTHTLPDGTKYVGQYKDDKKNGQGSLTSPDGNKYVGQFKDDNSISNQGKEYLTDGRQLDFNSNTTQLFSANGQLIRSNLSNSDLAAIRAESAVNKRRADQRLVKEQQKKDRQLAEQRRRDKKEIAGIQRQLIAHKYLRGSSDGIPGNKTSNAVKAFYRDAGIKRPPLDDYTTIAENLSSTLLSPAGNCPEDLTRSSGFVVCFTVHESDTINEGNIRKFWVLRVAGFAEKYEAENLMNRLKINSYKAFLKEGGVDDQVYFRVYVGPQKERHRAVADKVKIDRVFGTNAMILKYAL